MTRSDQVCRRFQLRDLRHLLETNGDAIAELSSSARFSFNFRKIANYLLRLSGVGRRPP
jgi:hypothetical protein